MKRDVYSKDNERFNKRIKELRLDIQIIEDIMSGKMTNYTNNPIAVLREYLQETKDKLNQLLPIEQEINP